MSQKPMEVISFHFSLFFKDVIQRPDIEFKDLNDVMQNLFGGIPTIMEIPLEAPPEIPMMILKSETNDYVCQISRSRIDIALNRSGPEPSNQQLLNDFNLKAKPFVEYVLSKKKVVRFGLVARYLYRCENAVEVITEKYFKRKLVGATELSIRFNQPESLEGLIINDVVNFGATIALVEGTPVNGILVSRDINNVPGEVELTPAKLLNVSKSFAGRLSEVEIEGLIK